MRPIIAGLLLLYLASGFYIVKGNEKAAVQRFGSVVTTPNGEIAVRGSGLFYDWPWPFVVVNRVRMNEVRTLTVGTFPTDANQERGFLQSISPNYATEFLTGDKNILNLQIGVQYRISERRIYDYLFASESPERRLKLLVESIVADLVSRSGVDFVHPLGLAPLREMMTERTQQLVEQNQLGLEIDEVSINSVTPPLRVKADFLDVSNARADRQKYVNSANAYAFQRLESAKAESQQIIDEATIFRQQTIEAARGAAARFDKIVEQFKRDEREGVQSYASARQMTLQRIYIDTAKEILSKAAGKVVIDSGKEIDLTIFLDPKQ